MNGPRENRNFCGWTRLAVFFSLDFVNMGFPVYGGTSSRTQGLLAKRYRDVRLIARPR